MRPSGPLIPPYPTYAMPYAGQQQTETSKLSPPWGGGMDAKGALAHGHRYGRQEPVGSESYRACSPGAKDTDALTAALVTRWSPGHAPISTARLR